MCMVYSEVSPAMLLVLSKCVQNRAYCLGYSGKWSVKRIQKLEQGGVKMFGSFSLRKKQLKGMQSYAWYGENG